jgi:nucleoside-diphosphate-sugar epimerase
MKILITGNMGYIGPCVVSHLRSSYPNVQLIGLDMGYFAGCLTNAESFPERKVDFQYFGDVRRISGNLLRDVDAIVHLAAISNDPMGGMFEEVTFDINYRASIELATKAKKAGVKTFVYASSCSIYGAAEDSAKSESAPLNPLTAYAKSKVFTEGDLEQLAAEKFKVTSLRFSTACGMSERLRLDLVLNDFVAGAVISKRITVLSDGTPWRPLINVKDMARAIDWAIHRELSDGGEFLAVNVGTDKWNYKVIDLAEAVARMIPNVDVSINQNAHTDKRSYRVNFDLFRKLAPEHQPRFDLIESINELAAGLEAMTLNNGDIRNSKYIRLKVLTRLLDRGFLTEKLEWDRT